MKPGEYLYVEADSNDGDYVFKTTPIDSEQLEILRPLIEAIRNFKPYTTKTEDGEMDWTHRHNWPQGEYLPRTDLGEKFPSEIYSEFKDAVELFQDEFLPPDLHTIHDIYLIEISDSQKLL